MESRTSGQSGKVVRTMRVVSTEGRSASSDRGGAAILALILVLAGLPLAAYAFHPVSWTEQHSIALAWGLGALCLLVRSRTSRPVESRRSREA